MKREEEVDQATHGSLGDQVNPLNKIYIYIYIYIFKKYCVKSKSIYIIIGKVERKSN